MSTRKAKRRPKAGKPREIYLRGYTYTFDKNGMVEIDGHLLNAEQFAVFARKVEERWQFNTENPDGYARSCGLSDLLNLYKPTAKAKDRLLRLSLAAQEVLSAIGAMREYHWFCGEAVRTEGCACIERLLEEAELRIQRLRHFNKSMALEDSTKLQDLIKREDEFERIGKEYRP
jgi:hypothetical protein